MTLVDIMGKWGTWGVHSQEMLVFWRKILILNDRLYPFVHKTHTKKKKKNQENLAANFAGNNLFSSRRC